MDELEPMLTTKDVAKLVGVSVRSVQRLRDRGAMPASLKAGRLNRWLPADIREWMAAGMPSPRKTGWKPARQTKQKGGRNECS